MTTTIYQSFPKTPRADTLARAQGLITQNYERQSNISTTIMIGQTIYFMSVGLNSGETITNVSVHITAAGVTMSLSKVGLYTKAGVRLAISAEQGTAWESAGLKTVPFTSAYKIATTDGYWVAVVANGATLPTMERGNTNAVAAVGTGMLPHGTLAAQTDLPASVTPVATSPIAYWVGLS